jgi:hypothetical protein
MAGSFLRSALRAGASCLRPRNFEGGGPTLVCFNPEPIRLMNARAYLCLFALRRFQVVASILTIGDFR